MAKKFSNMSIDELEVYREVEQGKINSARASFRKAGAFLDAALQGQSAAELRAAAEALNARAEKLEDSDG